VGGLIWFTLAQRRPERPVVILPGGGDSGAPAESATDAAPAAGETAEAGETTVRSEDEGGEPTGRDSSSQPSRTSG
jgi:hypothetical protein